MLANGEAIIKPYIALMTFCLPQGHYLPKVIYWTNKTKYLVLQ